MQQAYKLDFINDMADSIGQSIQTLAGVTQSGFSSTGFYVGFLLLIILVVGMYVAYTGLIKRETSKALHAVINFVVVFVPVSYTHLYEQYVKFGIPLEEADIINRFEIRLRNERAYYAVRDLLTYYDAEQTAFSIINQYVRFVDEEPDKRKNDWKLNDRWAWFIGDNKQSLKLTTKPEPYTLERTLRWVQRQVAPTLKMLKKIDKGNGTDYMETIEQQAKLTEKHEMIIKQQTTPAKDLVES